MQMAGWANAAEAAEAMLVNGAPPDPCDERLRTPCHAAAASDSSEALEVLISCGADIEARDQRGWTPLAYSIRACHCCDPACQRTRALALLLAHGANIEAPDASGWTPLHHAAASNRVAAVALLLTGGANPSAPACGTGCRPLMLAAHAGGTESVRLLLAAGAEPMAKDDAGTTALHAAADARSEESLDLLLKYIARKHAVEYGTEEQADRPFDSHEDADSVLSRSCVGTNDVNELSSNSAVRAAASCADIAGRTPLHFAAAAGSVGCVRRLAEAGANTAAASEIGWRPLHEAVNASQPMTTTTLLELGAPVDAADPDGTTALHLAALRVGAGVGGCQCKWCRRRRGRQLRTMRSLLNCQACDPNAANRHGMRPAHIAAAYDSAMAMRFLRSRHAALWARDSFGRSPMDVARLARAGKPSKVVRMLLLLGSRPPSIVDETDVADGRVD